MSRLRFRLPWTWSSWTPKPEPVRERDLRLPEIHYASDEDGSRFMIIDAAEADMSGWKVEGVRNGDVPFVDEFEQREAPTDGEGRWWLAYPLSEEWRSCWVALAEWGSTDLWLVDPQGERHEMDGYIRGKQRLPHVR